jgi:hypothetical protein
MGASNNAQGQNAGARQQINQQTTQAGQRLMEYLSQNPGILQGVPPPQAPGAAFMPGGMPPAAPTPQGSIGSITPQSAVTQPGMGGVNGQRPQIQAPQQGQPQPQLPPQLMQALMMKMRGGQ